MATNPQTTGIGRFTPSSLKDFSARARSLSELLGTPLQRTQGELARLYGYSGVHEIHAAIAAAERDPTLAGPYDSAMFSLSDTRDPQWVDIAGRGNRTLEVAAALLGSSPKDWPKEVWDARDLGLFDEGPRHRMESAKVLGKRAMVAAVNDPDATPVAAGVHAYAIVDRSSMGEAVCHFTQLGQQVHDAIEEMSGEDPDIDGLEKIAEIHAGNPWAHLALLEAQAWGLGQYPWTCYAPSNLAPEDGSPATLNLMILAKGRSTPMLKIARRAVELFDQLYKGRGNAPLAPSNLIGIASRHGSDTEGYPRALYLTALIRTNGPHGAKATTAALRKALRADPRVDTKEALAMHLLGERDFAGAARTVDPEGALVGPLVHAWKAAHEGDADALSDHLATAMQTNPWLVDAFEYDPTASEMDDFDRTRGRAPKSRAPSWGGNDGTQCLMPYARRLAIDEFLWRCGRHGPQADLVRAILAGQALREAYIAYWKANDACIGIYDKDASHQHRVTDRRKEALHNLRVAVTASMAATLTPAA